MTNDEKIAAHFAANASTIQARLDQLVADQPEDAEDDGESYITLAYEIAVALGLADDVFAEDAIADALAAFVAGGDAT